jgi:N-acetyl-anhydromuramyl-L-alanine amidase AmpD
MTSLSRIIFHWTGSTYTPNDTDKQHYHFIIDGDGKVIKGKYKPEDNTNCQDGIYARHTGGMNTGSIGIAISAMYSKDYPIKRIQLEAACKLAAELSIKYGIRLTSKNILTHAKVGQLLPRSTSAGKIDINNLPCVAVYGIDNVCNWLLNKINWYRSKM